MKKSNLLVLILMTVSLLCLLSSCEKDDEGSGFSNSLILGTGINGFVITGETANFVQTANSIIIYFRIESEEDMAGRIAVLDFETSSGLAINTITREQAQDYGHILISSFEWYGGTGSFKVTASLAEGNDKVKVASVSFNVQ